MSARRCLARCRCLDITGVGCPGWLNQQQMHLFLRDGTMLNAFRYNVHLPRPKGDRSISKLDVEHAFEDEKKSSVSSCLCQTNSPFTFTTMTSQLLNWAMARGDQCSENVASSSDKSILSLMDASDIVACEFTR